MASLIEVKKFGAYLVDDRIKYYLVQWMSEPWIVEGENLETAGGIARNGEWVCKGVWLNNVARAPRWYWVSDDVVIDQCQFVLCSDIVQIPHGTNNKLPRLNDSYHREILELEPIKLSEDCHNILMDSASLQEGLDYEEEFPDDSSAGSDLEEMDNDDADTSSNKDGSEQNKTSNK